LLVISFLEVNAMRRTLLVSTLLVSIAACTDAAQPGAPGTIGDPDTSGPAPGSPTPPAGATVFGSFEASWPAVTPDEAAGKAHRGAEIMLGRAVPLQPFVDSARRALAGSDVWDAFPLGDGVLHVKYYTRRNDLRMNNELLNTESEADFAPRDTISEPQAHAVATDTFRKLAAAGMIDADHYRGLQFKVSTIQFLTGTSGSSDTRRVVTQYRFLANRRLNGIAFMNAGFSVGVHVSGQLSHLRFGGAQVSSRMAGAAPAGSPARTAASAVQDALGHGVRPLDEVPSGGGTTFAAAFDEQRAKARFEKEQPFAKVDWSGLRYILADDAQGPTIIDPLYVVTFSTHRDRVVSRRQYAGYSLRNPHAAPVPVVLSNAPTPNDTGDPRP
jgi:hypothetical protein